MTTKKSWASRVLDAVQENLASLPSEEQRREMIKSIDALKSYLDKVQSNLESLPDQTARGDTAAAIRTLSQGLERAKLDPAYAFVFGIPKKKTGTTPLGTPEDEAKVETSLRELSALTTDAVQRKLFDESYLTKDQLILLARKKRIVVGSHMTRQQIAERIFKRGFANPRAYDLIRKPANGQTEKTGPQRSD